MQLPHESLLLRGVVCMGQVKRLEQCLACKMAHWENKSLHLSHDQITISLLYCKHTVDCILLSHRYFFIRTVTYFTVTLDDTDIINDQLLPSRQCHRTPLF